MSAFLLSALALWIFFSIVFIGAQYLNNNSIVDSFWGPAFLLVAIVTFLTSDVIGLRAIVLFTMVAVWALRLFLYITVRNWNKPEDYRYINMRKQWGTSFVRLKAYANVFILQGVLAFAVSLPIIVTNTSANQELGAVPFCGHRVMDCRFSLRDDRGRATQTVQIRSKQQGQADDGGSVAVHAPSELLWRGRDVVGHFHRSFGWMGQPVHDHQSDRHDVTAVVRIRCPAA